jgi:hypothetical protein
LALFIVDSFPLLGFAMNPLLIVLALLSLLPVPAAIQSVGSLTLLEGSLRVIRGASVLQGAEGMRLRQGDILESSDGGFAQLEFVGGAIVALGPSSRVYIFRYGVGGKGGGDAAAADFVLLRGWLKAESNSATGLNRFETTSLAASTGNGVLIFHSDESGCDIFVESGSASIGEVSADGYPRQPKATKAGQFLSRHGGKSVANFSRPTPAFVDAMPQPFRDTLPSRLAHFTGKPVEPKAQHAVSYAEIEAWLTMPAAWRRGFVDRFESRLKDPEFRKQLETHLAQYPEWDPILHPEKYPPQGTAAPAPKSETSHPRI